METMGNRIERARIAAGLTVPAFAKLCGVTRQTVYMWQRDATTPAADNLVTISDLTGWSIRRIVRGELQAPDVADKVSAEAIAQTPEEQTLLKDFRQASPENRKAGRRALLAPASNGLVNVPAGDPEQIHARNEQRNIRAVDAEEQAKKKYERRKTVEDEPELEEGDKE